MPLAEYVTLHPRGVAHAVKRLDESNVHRGIDRLTARPAGCGCLAAVYLWNQIPNVCKKIRFPFNPAKFCECRLELCEQALCRHNKLQAPCLHPHIPPHEISARLGERERNCQYRIVFPFEIANVLTVCFSHLNFNKPDGETSNQSRIVHTPKATT